jgi:bla regulator protein blaR1
MTSYCINTILCSAIFWAAYQWLLAPLQRHRFNRGYLLLSLVVSFVIPLLHFEVTSPAPWPNNWLLLVNGSPTEAQPALANPTATAARSTFLWWLVGYAVVTGFLLLRLCRNAYTLWQRARCSTSLPLDKARLVLLDTPTAPYSFGRYVFVNQAAYLQGQVPQPVLQHELAHVAQKHTYDILFLEILTIFYWFNPILWLYKKPLQLNHEFLADAAVLNSGQDIAAYQYLLIAHTQNSCNNYTLAAPFSYSFTKKRLQMMTKANAPYMAICRQLAVLPVLALAIALFSAKSWAQTTIPAVVSKADAIPFTEAGISATEMAEYAQLTAKPFDANGIFNNKLWTEADQQKVKTLYLSMSKAQQAQQTVTIMLGSKPLPKIVPTAAQLQAWQNPQKYGVWLDGKRVANSQLRQYAPGDFSQVSSSKLYKNAAHYGQYVYHLDLMTNDYYTRYLAKAAKWGKYYILFKFAKAQNGAGGAMIVVD